MTTKQSDVTTQVPAPNVTIEQAPIPLLTRESINSDYAAADWQAHARKTPARMMPWQGAAVVVDKQGTYQLADDFNGYIAVDEDGDPYAVSQDEYDADYQPGSDDGKTTSKASSNTASKTGKAKAK